MRKFRQAVTYRAWVTYWEAEEEEEIAKKRNAKLLKDNSRYSMYCWELRRKDRIRRYEGSVTVAYCYW
jgi:hypothetical protein